MVRSLSIANFWGCRRRLIPFVSDVSQIHRPRTNTGLDTLPSSLSPKSTSWNDSSSSSSTSISEWTKLNSSNISVLSYLVNLSHPPLSVSTPLVSIDLPSFLDVSILSHNPLDANFPQPHLRHHHLPPDAPPTTPLVLLPRLRQQDLIESLLPTRPVHQHLRSLRSLPPTSSLVIPEFQRVRSLDECHTPIPVTLTPRFETLHHSLSFERRTENFEEAHPPMMFLSTNSHTELPRLYHQLLGTHLVSLSSTFFYLVPPSSYPPFYTIYLKILSESRPFVDTPPSSVPISLLIYAPPSECSNTVAVAIGSNLDLFTSFFPRERIPSHSSILLRISRHALYYTGLVNGFVPPCSELLPSSFDSQSPLRTN